MAIVSPIERGSKRIEPTHSSNIHLISFIMARPWFQSVTVWLSLAALVTTKTNSWLSFADAASSSSSTSATDAHPPFFLQDPTDSLCLAGETFRRCSIETLWYVKGPPGSYQIHKRPSESTIDDIAESDDDGLCIAKKSCSDADATTLDGLKVTKCSHCGAKHWNILGDADTGYVLTFGGGSGDDFSDESSSSPLIQTCVFRKDDTAMTAPCDSSDVSYTPLQLRFATPSDISAMSSPTARLMGAAAEGDLVALKALLNEDNKNKSDDDTSKLDINVQDWDGLNALIPAASAGHAEVCQFLIEQGIDVNAADKDGITALMEASISGHAFIVQLLLDNGAQVNAASASSEVTALWLAASEGQTECLRLLLANGATATATRSDGISAVMSACVGGHVDAVSVLVNAGADVRTTDKDGLTPLMNAAENGTVATLELLTAAADNDDAYLNAMSKTGFTALIIAAAHGHADAVRHLIQAGANVEATADSAVTALMFASASNHIEVMKVLMEDGNCNIEARHHNGGTALLEAATGGASKALRLLIEHGAVADIVDSDGVTPLMAVASFGSTEGQNLILDALKAKLSAEDLVAHINSFSLSGGSTIMFATAGGHLENAKQLLALGADAKAIARATPEYLEKLAKGIEDGTYKEEDSNVDGVTALHVAAQGGHLETVQFLVDEAKVDVSVADDESRTPLTLAIKGNYGEVASALVKAGADPNTPYVDAKGETHNLLFDAIMTENDEFANLLIENGANLYHKDEKNVSCLLQASHRGMSDIVKLLLDKHSTSGKPGYVDEPSDEGISPLIAAASEGHVDVVKHLLAAKANVNVKDQDQTTALMAASARGHTKVVKELLAAGALINEQNADGHTALMFAYNGKNQVDTLWERYTQYVKETEDDASTTKTDLAADDNGTGTIIRDALDTHIALVEMLVQAGANLALKDKEGHTAKDFDFHPNANADVLAKEAKAEKVRDESKNEL